MVPDKYVAVLSKEKTMQFYITVNYKQQELSFSVKDAVYLDRVVYQVRGHNLHTILYKNGDGWAANEEMIIEQELIEKIGTAVTNHYQPNNVSTTDI